MLDDAPAKQRNVIVRPHGAGVTLHPARRPQGRSAPSPRPRRVSHARNLAREFSGLGRAARRRGQGFCAAAAQRHRRRPHRQRRHARRRQPQFQGQIRARLSARGDPRGAAGPPGDAPPSSNGSGWWPRRNPSPQPLRILPPPDFPRQPQMAELCPLPRWRAAQQRGNRPRLSAGPILSSA